MGGLRPVGFPIPRFAPVSRFEATRPGAGRAFYKAHGLGNDYLVVEQGTAWTLDEASVRSVCHRHEGVGSDGVVVVLHPAEEPFRLRMFNPDGSEFERSGNGLRIAASWLHRTGRVEIGRPFGVDVGGDRVTMIVHGLEAGEYDVSVEMGLASVGPEAVELDRDAADPGGEPAGPDGESTSAMEGAAHGRLVVPSFGPVPVHLVSVGNPHCVIFTEMLDGSPYSRDTLDRLGPPLAVHRAFTHGANVQLARIRRGDAPGGGAVDAMIWERGVGHTTASGTSACAVAVAAVESGRLAPGPVEVHMEGGVLSVDVSPDLAVVLRGPVREIMTGELS
jgi:diaminopimelate epimerase